MGESNDSELKDRIYGLLYGNAIGDAIGLLTEFMFKKDAEKYYGGFDELEYEQKVPDMHRQRWKTGDWTDDTDQMILIMLSIMEQKGEVSPTDFGSKMKNWTRKGFPELGDFAGMGIGATTKRVMEHQLFDSDPHSAAYDVWDQSGQVVAPNGAIMRTSVLGTYKYQSLADVQKNTLDICKVTHADPRCQASTVAMTTAIALMLQKNAKYLKKDGSYNIDAIIKTSYLEGKKLIKSVTVQKELKKYMFAEKIKELKLDEHGKIGYTFKCLGAGFWALKQNDFRKALQKLIMQGGDADTNGAVAGALLGCKLGTKCLPSSWLNRLLHKAWFDEIIGRFMPYVLGTETKEVSTIPKESTGSKVDNSIEQCSTELNLEENNEKLKDLILDVNDLEESPKSPKCEDSVILKKEEDNNCNISEIPHDAEISVQD